MAEIDGVLYVNDSKATNVAAAVAGAARPSTAASTRSSAAARRASASSRLAEPVAERCVACYLIGEAAEQLARDAGAGRASRASSCAAAATSSDAVARGRGATRSRARSSCSRPACASFDAFRDFEERGERFRELVEELER